MRLSYNVWMMDSDIILFDDPYKYWKSPPFANYTIIDQIEVLYVEGDQPKPLNSLTLSHKP